MIKYSLQCDQGHAFEGWFRNSQDFDDQVAAGHLSCPFCHSANVRKSLMAPAVTGTRSQNVDKPSAVTPSQDEGSTSIASAGVPSGASEVESGVDSPAQPAPIELSDEQREAQSKLNNALREIREKVTKNADYVGDKFAEEARKMHFNETEKRGIYGEATIDDVKELAEDGVDFLPLPVLPEDKN